MDPVEHGRWTRGLSATLGDEDMTLRMVEAESIPGIQMKDPSDRSIGYEYSDGPADIRPEEFTN